MNAIRTINLTKQILLISFVFFLSCKKQTEVSSPPQKPLSENAFFSRAKISANQSDRDLVDTIIDFCKRADDISHFSDAVINKYGYPKWDLTMTLQNENGLKTLFVPVVDSADRVRLIISAYQQSKDKFLFKMIAKDMQHPGLPKSSNDNKVFTQQSLAGIFNSFEKRVIELKNIPNSPSSNIETRGLGFTFSWLCWTESWMDETGGFFMTNTKCSYTITFTPDAYGGIASVPDLPEIGGGGGGGGGDGGDGIDPCANAEQEALNQLKLQFDEHIASETPITHPIFATQIDLNPYHEIKNWTIVEGSVNHWKVSATTVIDLSYDNFPSTYNRTLSLKSSGSQYEGANNFIISTWTPSTPEIRINQNHSRYPSGIVTESGILNHRMRAHITFTYGGCTIDVNPGFETTGRQSNSLSVIVQ
jgi:hypothetical protein